MLALFGFGWAPVGWALCNGQLLAISQNTALFSLLGTTYGGDGRTTFGLPDLRGRVPLHWGQGPGLSNYDLGEVTGTETVTLTVQNLASHGHGVQGSATASSKSPAGLVPAFTPAGSTYGAPDGTAMANNMVGNTGNNQPFGVLQPLLAMCWCIATEGIYPSRP
jgi:microcystin-dependent protein